MTNELNSELLSPEERKKHTLRAMVRGTYDLQKQRIMAGNRIVIQFRSRVLGIKGDQKEEDIDKDTKKVIDLMKVHYKNITKGIAAKLDDEFKKPSKRSFKGNEIISEYSELCMLHQYFELEAMEARGFRQIESVLDEHPIYTRFLRQVVGIGPALAGYIISEIDISKAPYPASLEKYIGIDVVMEIDPETGEITGSHGRSMRKEDMITVKYKAKDGTEKEKLSLTFKKDLRAKMIGVLASCFLRSRSPYSNNYYNYKNRISNAPEHKDKTLLHKHRMATRYMLKFFVRDLYIAWKYVSGMEIRPAYEAAKLGILHNGVTFDDYVKKFLSESVTDYDESTLKLAPYAG